MNIKPRGEGRKNIVKKILIVCEGEKTEPNYFRAFRVAKQVCVIRGTGKNTLSLVKHATELAKADDYREVWCVFDRDSFPPANVLAAYTQAAAKKIKIAFSNECFELWYLLHFKYLDVDLRRAEYYKQLALILGNYEKNSIDMYEKLRTSQVDAIKNASRLERIHAGQPNYCNKRPYTSVHHLVIRLNKLASKSF